MAGFCSNSTQTPIQSIIQQCQSKGTKVILSGLQPQPQKILHNGHVEHGKDGVFFSPDYATSLKMAEDMISKDGA